MDKVLVGQRRTGKSTILRQFIRNLLDQGVNPQNIFYLDKEHLDFAELTESRELDALIQLYREKLAVQGKIYLLLDEVQEIEGWEKLAASYAQDNRHDYELYITGSNSHMLSSELGTYLSGRHVPIDVYPLAFPEFVDAYGVSPDKASLLAYLEKGGLPELIHLESQEARRHYVMALRDSILLNDIVKKFGVVVEKGDVRSYVQVCYLLADENIIDREYRSLEVIRDHYPKMVVSMDDVSFGTRNGIHHLSAWDLFCSSGVAGQLSM